MYLPGFITLLIFSGVFGMVPDSCPASWQEDRGECYIVETVQRLSWSDANNQCQTLGGGSARLVSIYDDAENDIIANLKSISDPNTDMWIGLQQCQPIATDGGWYWDNGDSYVYTNWVDNEPGTQYGCASMFQGEDSHWKSQACTDTMGIVCELENVTEANCDATIYDYDGEKGVCYFMNPGLRMDQASALTYCGGQGGSLASISDETEETFIRTTLATKVNSNEAEYVWIGLYNYAPDLEWQWVDGTPKEFMNWALSEPDNTDEDYLCAYMDVETGKWYSSPCDEEMSYVCEYIEASCPNGWVQNDGSCYYLSTVDTKSQIDAFRQCKKLNVYASLAMVITKAENEFLMAQLASSGVDRFWFGYIRCDTSDPAYPWLWLDSGTSVGQDGYQNFVNTLTTNGCAAMTGNNEWVDTDCSDLLPFACKATAGFLPVTTTTTAAPTDAPTDRTTTDGQTDKTTTIANDVTTNDSQGLLAMNYTILLVLIFWCLTLL